MIEYEISPQAKTEFMDSFELDDYQCIMKEGCLDDHILIRKVDKPIRVNDSEFDTNYLCDYVMILESAKEGMFGAVQCYNMYLFNENEIDDIVEKQCVFDREEIEYMECYYNEEDEYEEEYC